MLFPLIHYIFVLFPFAFSIEETKNIGFPLQETEIEIVHNRSSELKRWAEFINEVSDSLQFLYAPNAYTVLTNGEVIQGNQNIAGYHLTRLSTIESIYTDTIVAATHDNSIQYEIGGFEDDKGKKYSHMVIWKSGDSGGSLRMFEIIVEMNSIPDNPGVVNQRRKEWIALCNKHNAESLVTELYTENTIYFNRGRLVRSRPLLSREYQYMNKESYNLNLTPILSKYVNDHFNFEIGQCSGSYNGKYVIIWTKDNDNQWRVFVDSNI